MKIIKLLLIALLVSCNGNSRQKELTAWMDGGNLHSVNIDTWLNATESNKLATCADFLATYMSRKSANFSVLDKKFRKKAEALKLCIDVELYDVDGSEKVTATVVKCLKKQP